MAKATEYVVVKGTVRHNKQHYAKGAVLPEMPAKDVKRLVEIGVAAPKAEAAADAK